MTDIITLPRPLAEELLETIAAPHPAAELRAALERALAAPPNVISGWIVGNGNDDRWRAWEQGNPVWVDDREQATRYARRADAEAVHAEDEDAWRVVPYPVSAPALAPGSGHTHTALMGALFGELMRQWPEAFSEAEGNSTIAIPAVGGYVKLDVSSLAEVVLPMVAAAPSPGDPRPSTDCPGTDLSIERIKGWLACYPHGGSEPLHPDDLRALLNIALRVQGTVSAALTFEALHRANIDRQEAWCPGKSPDLSFRGNELAGETGEACNVIKKLERERHGWAGSRDTLDHLAEELADVVICADLCAITAGVDLQAAVVAKFNATSEKVGLPRRLPALPRHPSETDQTIETAERLANRMGATIALDPDRVAAFRGTESDSAGAGAS